MFTKKLLLFCILLTMIILSTGFAGQYFYHLHDHLGNTRVVVDGSKNVVERYDYYPFGLVSRSTVSDEAGTIQKFTGKELDDEHGIDLYYFGARYHDPVIGRFTSVDTLAEKYAGWTPYHYAANNPLKYVDPDGRKVEIYSVPIGIAGIKTGHKHLFIVVRNKNTGTFTSRGLYPKNYWKAAKSIVTKGKSIPVVHKDKKSELGEVKKLYAGKKSNTTLETVIDIPEGMTEEEFDQKTLEEADNYPVDKKPYDANEGPNSNTFVDDVVEGAGGTMPDIPGATQQNYGEKKKDEKDE